MSRGEAVSSHLRPVPVHRYLTFFGIALSGAVVDVLSKEWAFADLGYPTQRPIWLIDGILSLETSLNEGALFGLGQGWTWLFAVLSIAAALGIVTWLFMGRAALDAWLNVALACVMGGILGNLYDRLGFHGMKWPFVRGSHRIGDPVYAVRDWIHFQYGTFDWPIFNIADSLLVCGAGLLVWHSFRQPVPASAQAKLRESTS